MATDKAGSGFAQKKDLVSACLKFCSERVVLNVSSFLTNVIMLRAAEQLRNKFAQIIVRRLGHMI